jgi:alginate O-acetyltransferase complex protein AlgI
VVWGAYHGALLAFERWRGKTAPYHWLPRGGRVAFTFVLVLISWVLFRSSTLTAAIHYLGAMLGINSSVGPAILLGAEIYTPYYLVILGLCAFLSFRRLEVYDWVAELAWPKAFALVPLFLLAIAAMFTQGLNPFLYFQF